MHIIPKVSVIIPVHNSELYLYQCLDSVAGQTLSEIEVICVDDCSSDNSVAILRQYAARDSRFVVITHTENVSACQCRKDAVLRSSGTYVMFIDSDDYLEPDACQTAYETIVEKSADILQFGTVVENCAKLPQSRIDSNQRALEPYTDSVLYGSLLNACFLENKISVNLWNKIFRGSLCRKAFSLIEDGFFPKANDLYAVFLLLHYSESFCGLSTPLYHYCFGRGMTGSNVMSLENFTLHCQSAKVFWALDRYVHSLTPEQQEICAPVLQRVRNNFLNEQCGRWIRNLDSEAKYEGFQALGDAWNGGLPFAISTFANLRYYGRDEVAERLVGAPFLAYRPRKIKTIALYYRSIQNGGAQRVVAQLCNLFSRAQAHGVSQYKVILVTDDPPAPEDYELSDQVIHVCIPHRDQFPQSDYGARVQAWSKLIEEYQIDAVLYSMWVDPTLFWDMLAIKSHPTHPAFVIHTHSCSSMIYRFQGNTVAESFSSYAIADSIITLSQCDLKYWQYINPRTYFVENPCYLPPAKQHRAKPGQKSVLWLGRISSEKQPLEMVRIMQYVIQEIPDAVCHMVGDGNERLMEQLEREIERFGLSEHIILDGFHQDVAEFYERASVFVMTSIFEGSPLTLHESASYGIPSVTYALPWLEYYSAFQGWAMVPQRDAAAAAREIVRLLSDDSFWKTQSDKTYRSFEAYAALDIVGKWGRVFSNLEQNAVPDTSSLDPHYGILFRQIGNFHHQGMSNLRASRDRRIAELNKKLQLTYAEKSEINRKLQITYGEKFDRGVQIRELRAQVKELKKQLKASKQTQRNLRKKIDQLKRKDARIKKSASYRIGRILSWPFRKLRQLIRGK